MLTLDKDGLSGDFSKSMTGMSPQKLGGSVMFEIDTGINLPEPSTNGSSAAFSGTYCGLGFTCVGASRDIKTGNQTFQFGFGTKGISPSIVISPRK